MTFPAQHRVKLHSTNPLECLNGEIKRRTEVVGIFPDEAAITRLVCAFLLEQNDEWAVQHCRYMTLESVASLGDHPPSACLTWRPDLSRPRRETTVTLRYLHHSLGYDPDRDYPTQLQSGDTQPPTLMPADVRSSDRHPGHSGGELLNLDFAPGMNGSAR